MSRSWRNDFDSVWWGWVLLGLAVFLFLFVAMCFVFSQASINGGRAHQLKLQEVAACQKAKDVAACIKVVNAPRVQSDVNIASR